MKISLPGSVLVGSACVAVVISCGGGTDTVPASTSSSSSTSGAGGSSSSSGGASSSSSGATSSSSSGGTTVTCPATAPESGTACPLGNLACEYGTDPRPECRTVATCLAARETGGAKWSVQSPKCAALPPVTCPATRAAADGQTCTPSGAFCNYDGSVCECTNCVHYPIEKCSGPVTWHCEAPPADATCPAGRPRLGDPCTTAGQQCVYSCEPGSSRQCVDGHWATYSSPGGCPRSSRTVKTDIHYLSNAEVSSLATDARGLRLATWRYTGRLDDGRTHVGYILEDAPNAPSSNMQRGEVDLYNYMSMSLALAQDQQREIDDLKRQLDELRAQKSKR